MDSTVQQLLRHQHKHIYFLFNISDKLFIELAEELKVFNKQYEFFGLAYAKNDIFINNKLFKKIHYTPDLPFDGDIDMEFLLFLEKEYDIRIGDLLHMDRHILRIPRERRLFYAQELLRIIFKDLTENHITTVIAYAISDLASYFASVFCKKHGIKLLYPMTARLNERSFLSDDPNSGPINFRENFLKNKALAKAGTLDLENIQSFCTEYVTKKSTLKVSVSSSIYYRIFSLGDLKVGWSLLKAQLSGKRSQCHDRSFLSLPFHRLKRIIQANAYKKIIKKQFFNHQNNEKYAVFPLQLHPEAATTVISKAFNDQVRLIELISKGLPANIKLVVKEHPVAVGRRQKQFFDVIAQMHNVYFVPHNYDNYKLLSGSVGLITMSSSMAIEAFLVKKPAIIFGDVFYSISNNAIPLYNFREFPRVFDEMLNHRFDDLDLFALIKTLLTDSFIFDPVNYTKKELGIFAIKSHEYIGS